jgi:hypothetical protein
MPRFTPYSLRMQIGRMFESGQSFFCEAKVRDWLKERREDPNAYEIIFHPRPAPSGCNTRLMVDIELRRVDGQPVADWLQEDVNYSA